jgi:flagellar hook-associated protein 2
MATITSTGVGSGLDVNSIVSSLMTLEQRPLTLLQTKASTMQTQVSALGSLKSQIASLGDVASRLADAANWKPLSTTSSDAASVAGSAGSGAKAGQYTVEVTQLAQAQALSSGSFASSSATVGTGQLTLELGTTAGGVFTPQAGKLPTLIPITSANQSLAGIRDAINASGAGVNASIVNSGGTSRLVLRGPSGESNSLRITVADDDGQPTDGAGLSALAWDPAAAVGAGRNMSQTQAAQDARYTLNGLSLSSASNTVANVVDGLTLTLGKVTSQPVEVGVSIDSSSVRKNLNDFISSYNSLNTLIKNQTQADPTGKANGVLQGDFTARALASSITDVLHGAVTGLGSAASLNAAGIELQRDGSLKINETRLAPLLATPEKLQALFTQAQSGSDTASRGIALRFKQWSAALTADTGPLTSRTQGLTQSLTNNQKAQDAAQAKLTATEARLRAQYQTLDSQMGKLNAQLAQMKSALGLTTSSSG